MKLSLPQKAGNDFQSVMTIVYHPYRVWMSELCPSSPIQTPTRKLKRNKQNGYSLDHDDELQRIKNLMW